MEPFVQHEADIQIERPTLKCNNCGEFVCQSQFSGDVCLKCVEKDKAKQDLKTILDKILNSDSYESAFYAKQIKKIVNKIVNW